MRTPERAPLCAVLAAALLLSALCAAAWADGEPDAPVVATSVPMETAEPTEAPAIMVVTSAPMATAAPAAQSGAPAPTTAAPADGTQAPEATPSPLAEGSAIDVLGEPYGILPLEDGSLLVTDGYSKTVWQVTDGVCQPYAGAATVEDIYGEPLGGYLDKEPDTSFFRLPWAIAPFLDGYAVSDRDNNVIRLLLADKVQTLNGKSEEKLATGDSGVAFDHPTGLAADDEGNLYVSDTLQNAIRKIDPEGNVTTVTGALTGPMGLCWKDGTLYVAEAGGNRVVKITAEGRVMVVAGSGQEGSTDGPAALASFSAPQGVAVDDEGTIYVSDTANSAIRRIKNSVVDTLLVRDASDPASDAPVSPEGMAAVDGKLYVCDSFARRVLVIDLDQ